MNRVRRSLHALTCLGAVAHHGFELGAGVGLVFQPYLGMGGAAALWGISLPGWFLAAARGSRRWDRPLAFLAGASMGAAVLHYLLWPVRWRRGLPLLASAEGLRPEHLPAYNALLYAWAGLAAAAIALETPREARPWALAGGVAALPFRRSATRHFLWIAEQARVRPAWWNRALAGSAR